MDSPSTIGSPTSSPIVSSPFILSSPTSSWDIFGQYVKVMNEYLLYFSLSEKFKKREKDCIYLLLNGFTTLTHVFKITLNHPKMPVVQAIESTEKAIYYYTQYIEQIEENLMYDLNLSSNTASLFVYKKTIYTLSNEDVAIETNADVLNNVNNLLLIYRSLFEHLMQKEYNPYIPAKLYSIAMEMCKTKNENDFHREMTNTMLFINHFPLLKNNDFSTESLP